MIIIRAKEEVTLKQKAQIIAEIRDELPNLEVIQRMCKDLGFSMDILDGIIYDFEKLDVSAKTIDSKIYLNEDLLNAPTHILMRYVVHETCHALQHMEREHLDKDPYDGYDYLDRPDESAAFDYQTDYQIETEGSKATVKYLEELMEHHDVPNNKRKEKIKEILN